MKRLKSYLRLNLNKILFVRLILHASVDVFLYDFQNNKLLFSNFLAYFFLVYCLGKILRKKALSLILR